MDKRTLLAIVLSLAVLFVFQTFFIKRPEPQPVVSPDTTIESRETAPAALTPDVPKPVAAAKPTVRQEEPPRDIRVETPNYIAVFSTRGGALKSFQLKNYYQVCYDCPDDIFPKIKSFFTGSPYQPQEKTKDFIELVDVHAGMPYPLAVTFPESSADLAADAIFQTTASNLDLTVNADRRQIIFSRSTEFIRVEKVYTFTPDNYTISLDVVVHNLTAAPITQIPMLSWHQYMDPNRGRDTFSHDGPIISVSGSVTRQDIKKINGEILFGPHVLWGAFESKYFIASFIPESPALTNVQLTKESNEMISLGMKSRRELIPGGQQSAFAYTLFMGPKSYDELKAMSVGLENAIDYGWFKWLAIPFLKILKFLNGFVHNFGIAIILLTLMIKIIFWPLGTISYKSMKKMQQIQPKVLELKEKYKNDQSKIGQETMALYRENKVNPLSGCLPILIQIPVFFGLYKALMYSIELRHSPFFFWIMDMSAKDPYYITPVVMGVTQFIQQKMSPAMGDPMQQKIMLMMPVIFTFFFMNFPAGLVIYWLFNNLFSIGQQYYINKRITV